MSDTVRDKMFEARDLIQAKRYAQARTLLNTIDHPKATEWLRKLDDVEARERGVGTQVAHQRQMQAETVETYNPYPQRQQAVAYPQQHAPYAPQQPQQAAYAPMPSQAPYAPQYAPQPAYAPQAMPNFDAETRIVAEAPRKRTNALHIIGALIGGLLGGAIGAAIWAAVAYFTEYEVGYVALAVGLLAGLFAVLFSGGRRGIPIQIIAILTALLGIFVGKYAALYALGVKLTNEQVGSDMTNRVLQQLPPLDPNTIRLFVDQIVAALQPVDALFVVLAVLAAIGVAAGRRERQPKVRTA
jgi:hypothetical protein